MKNTSSTPDPEVIKRRDEYVAKERIRDAAPELLEALKHSAHTIEQLEKELRHFRPGSYAGSAKARAAIAKAEIAQ